MNNDDDDYGSDLTDQELAQRVVKEQRAWIEENGGGLAGYILRYGSKDDPEHFGDGAEAIYEADLAALMVAEAELACLVGR